MTKDNPANDNYIAPLPYDFWVQEVKSVSVTHQHMTLDECIGAVMFYHQLANDGKYALDNIELDELRDEVHKFFEIPRR